MPLRAKLEGTDIYAFNFDDVSWSSLRKQPVQMYCCESKAILKKSKLGTRFFSHYRKGDCASEGESAQHIYLKNLISLIALRFGWQVETEKHGETPAGEKWIADVYCTKGNAKIAFEVQWSHQTRDEFLRRQKKYISSNVRAAWLFKLKNNKEYWSGDIPHQFDTPVFGMKVKSKGVENIYVPQFDEPIESFIEGMFQGNLVWSPKIGQRLKAEVIPRFEKCWKCKKEIGVVIGVSIKDSNNREIAFERFCDDGVPEFILKNGVADHLSMNKIGKIKKRYSRTMGEAYLSNGCFYCDAIIGNFFLFPLGALTEDCLVFESLVEDCDDPPNPPNPIYSFEYEFGQSGPYIRSEWYFNQQSKHMF